MRMYVLVISRDVLSCSVKFACTGSVTILQLARSSLIVFLASHVTPLGLMLFSVEVNHMSELRFK